MLFHTRLIWFPSPEFISRNQEKELLRLVNDGKQNYTILFSFPYSSAYQATQRPWRDENNRPLSREDFPANELNIHELRAKGYIIDNNAGKQECSIQILPRSEDELRLLQEWYMELPTAVSIGSWTMENVFAHPCYVRNAPFAIESFDLEELWDKRRPLYEAQSVFFTSMITRTPESLARIKRTNELTAQILELAKQPDSTISQNMVEFIQLRSFLIDMRYAENPNAEQDAFNGLVKFVENAKDKELWLKFLDEIGFGSILYDTHFPLAKIRQYRKLFSDHFSEDFKKIGWTVTP
jgi:hypothetical protein